MRLMLMSKEPLVFSLNIKFLVKNVCWGIAGIPTVNVTSLY